MSLLLLGKKVTQEGKNQILVICHSGLFSVFFVWKAQPSDKDNHMKNNLRSHTWSILLMKQMGI